MSYCIQRVIQAILNFFIETTNKINRKKSTRIYSCNVTRKDDIEKIQRLLGGGK